MAKRISIVLMVALGFLLIPSMNTFVSGNTTTEISCCEKKMADDCCDNSHTDSDSDEPCHGDCGNASCTCASASSSASFLLSLKTESIISFNAQLNLPFPEAFTPSVLLSIWAPPKIS